MRQKKRIKSILGHICIICGLALMVIQVLDWYNPFMDFMGHSMFLLYFYASRPFFWDWMPFEFAAAACRRNRTGFRRKSKSGKE